MLNESTNDVQRTWGDWFCVLIFVVVAGWVLSFLLLRGGRFPFVVGVRFLLLLGVCF